MTSAARRATSGTGPSALRDWQHGVLEMVRTEGADKRDRTLPRLRRQRALGRADGRGVRHTAGVSGAEVGIAGGSAVVGQKLLEAVFGDQAVRRLAAAARQDLNERVTALMDEERARYLEVLGGLGMSRVTSTRCRPCRAASTTLRFRDSGPGVRRRWAESEDVTALVEGAKKLVGKRTDVVDRIDGLDEAARASRGRLDALVDEAAAVAEQHAGARLGCRPTTPSSR